MVGRRLTAGAKLVVSARVFRDVGRYEDGQAVPVPLEYATAFVMRRRALPTRAASCRSVDTGVFADSHELCIDPSLVGAFRVRGATTTVKRLRMPWAQSEFRVACRGRSCPEYVHGRLDGRRYDRGFPENCGLLPCEFGLDYTETFRGKRLAPGTRITLGYLQDDLTSFLGLPETYTCAVAQWTTRRGRAPRRRDIGPYEGLVRAAVRRACNRPFR